MDGIASPPARDHTRIQEGSVPVRRPEQISLDSLVLLDRLSSISAKAQVLCATLPGYVAVGRRAAAWLWGVDALPRGWAESDWQIELMVPRKEQPPRRPGCRGYVTEFLSGDVNLVDGVRVTSLERTALDCARWLPRLEAVAALDQFLRRGVRAEWLHERALLLAGERYARRLREVISLGDGGSDSCGESWTRALLVDAGLPEPRTQVPVPGPNGGTLRIDLGLEEFGVGVEYDGAEHHSDPRDIAHDRSRRAWLRRRGWLITAVTKDDIWGDPRPFLADVLDNLLSRGWRPGDDRLCDIMTRIQRGPYRGRRRR